MNPVAHPWRSRRRLVLLASAILAASVGLAAVAQTTPPGRAPATRPAPTAADKAAAIEHFQKARSLFAEKKYAEANAQNNEALKRDPTLNDAQLLRTVLQDKIGDAGGPAGPAVAGGTNTGGGKTGLLTPQQISVIRLLEMKDDDRTVRGEIPRQVRQDFWDNIYVKLPDVDTSPEAHNSFLNPNNFFEIAKQIRQSLNMNYIQSVTVRNDPESLAQFRSAVQTYVLQNCATAACHGGNNAGDFHILNPAPNDQALYTNFYVMSMYNAKTGGKVIDRDNPDKSLIIQFALPRQQAAFPHPNNIEIRNKVTGPSDTRVQQMTAWISGLTLPRPNYGINYPVGGAPPAPEKSPATAPAGRGR